MNAFLIPKSTITGNGTGAAIEVAPGETLQLTLEILAVVEQESVEIRLEGSVDGETWLEKPVAAFPQKFYRGAWAIRVDLAAHGDVRWVRASWKTNRWGRGSLKPHFELYLFGESVASVALDSI